MLSGKLHSVLSFLGGLSRNTFFSLVNSPTLYYMTSNMPFRDLREKAGFSQSDLALHLDISREYILQHEFLLVNSPNQLMVEFLNETLSPRPYPTNAYVNFMLDYSEARTIQRALAAPLLRPPNDLRFRHWRAAHCRSIRQFAKLIAASPNDILNFEQHAVLGPFLAEAFIDLGVNSNDFRA